MALLQVNEFHHGQRTVTTLMARDGEATLPCLPLLLKVPCGCTRSLTRSDNFFFIIIVSPAKVAPQRHSLLPTLGLWKLMGFLPLTEQKQSKASKHLWQDCSLPRCRIGAVPCTPAAGLKLLLRQVSARRFCSTSP